MAEEKTEEAPEGGEKKKKSGLGVPVIIGIVLGAILLQVGLIYGVYVMFLKPHPTAEDGKNGAKTEEHASDEKDAKSKKHPKEEEEEDVVHAEIGKVVQIKDDIIINLRGANGASRTYVVVGVGLEVDKKEGEKAAKEIEEDLMIPIKSKIISVISSKSIDELQDSNKRDSLALMLRKDLKPIMGEIKLKKVYFSKFIIQ